jgi:hypothetical protein
LFLEHNGLRKTAYMWAALRSISPATILKRKELGWSDAQALEFALPPPKQPTVMSMSYNGEHHSFYEWGRIRKMSPMTIKYRHLSMGWTPGQALGIEPPPDENGDPD